jgi:CubicO group peptidase (beta-lactamase class C family)
MNNLSNLKRSIPPAMMAMLALLMLLSTVGSAAAQENTVAHRNVPTAPSQDEGPTDPAELQSFLDDLLGRQLAEDHLAGAAVSVVKDGKLLFAKGYGLADIEKGIAVDPERTVFPIGSISKLFTATAVMQLVEQGKLDLDADINTYLDFRIPDTYPQPITLKHLLTHTAGFEERLLEFDALRASDLVPSGEWLASHLPARVRPPGQFAAYSNYGAALAGYIVARVSGQSYDQYIQRHILDPLGMTHTSAQMPPPPDLHAHAAVGYTFQDGAFKRFPEYMAQTAIVPAGGMESSATDMARFMIAHLQNGRYSDANILEARILKVSTAEQMHSPLYLPDPRILGTAYAFFDFSDNGQRTLGHSGGSHPFYTLLLLLPDRNLGVFVAYDGQAGENLTLQHLGFQRAFFDHYFPAPAVAPISPPADFAERAGRFVGSYRVSAMSYTTLEKVQGLFGGPVEIRASGDGTLVLATPWGDWRFVEAAPLYFRQVDGQFSILFRQDDQGRITRMFTSLTPMFTFEKLEWNETPGFNMALLLGCILIFLSLLLVALIRLRRHRGHSAEANPIPRGARAAQWIILGTSLLNVLFVVGTVLWGNPAPLFGISVIYKVVLGLGVLAAALTLIALVCAALAWTRSYWGLAARLHYTLATLAAVAFVWFLNYWNLLGWRF